MRHPILILGGTAEARQLAMRLAARDDLAVELTLAGRTTKPVEQGVPARTGGFGGAEGLAVYVRRRGVELLVDATHPFAARISANAALAADLAGVRLVALRRPEWRRIAGDRWTDVDNSAAAVVALGGSPRAAFLALGRQELTPFETAPQHRYLVRSVDPVEPPLNVPHARYVLGRGPFAETDEETMLLGEGIDAIVCKNSGGEATYGKIAAARKLGIEVLMIRRPVLPDVPAGAGVEETEALAIHALGLA